MSRLTSTLKALVFSTAVALGLFASTQPASAQTLSDSYRIRIPFDFRVGKDVLPAGEYSAWHVQQNIYILRQVNGSASSSFTTSAADAPQPRYDSSMVFHRYGDTYFLSQIWRAGQSVGAQLPKSRGEQESAQAKLDQPPALVQLAMK